MAAPGTGVKSLKDYLRKYESSDISPPRSNDSLSPEPEVDMSPPRRRKRHYSPSPEPENKVPKNLREDLSPASRRPLRESHPPQTSKLEQRKTGLISGKDIAREYRKKKEDDQLRLASELTGQNAEPVFRDKITGKPISKEEYLKSKVVENPKEIKLEWGQGLAQKREAEARLQALELEKDKPFARTRDDPELDKMMKETVRWGDPMAHLVKHETSLLVDLGDDEKMKASGFVIPQSVPKHSWLTRGLEAAPNRYGIKPGRHWDGVDRSNGKTSLSLGCF